MNKAKIKRFTCILKPLSALTNSVYNNKINQRIILTYHGISKRPQFNCVTRDLFRDQISWLREHYSVISLSELVESFDAQQKYNSHLASITFDDGYVNFAEFALPILEEYGCHATIFVPSGKVGRFNDWDEGNSSFCKMPIMSYEQLRQLPGKVVEIGSHGISHTALDQLSFDDIEREIIISRLEIEQKVGRPIRFFAFPFGVYPFGRYFNSHQSCKKLLISYHAACTTWWGRFNSMKDIYSLRRIGVWESDSFEDFLDKLQGYYDWLVAKEKIGRFCKLVKSLSKQ